MTTEVIATQQAECAHHWLIETPSGETSEGMCKHCGAVRRFFNSSTGRTMTRAGKPAAALSLATTATTEK